MQIAITPAAARMRVVAACPDAAPNAAEPSSVGAIPRRLWAYLHAD
jgi:hypothetical protein